MDLLKNNTLKAIKTCIPTFFQHGRHLHFGDIDHFFDSSSYISAIIYTIVAQKVTQCFRKYKKADKRSENPFYHSVHLIIPSIPPIH